LNVLLILVVVLFIAFLVETLVEFVTAPLFDKVPILTPYKWTVMYVAIAVAITAAFLYKLDLIYMLAQFLGVDSIPQTIYGLVATGIAIGKGSNYLHDLIQKFFVKPTTTESTAVSQGGITSE